MSKELEDRFLLFAIRVRDFCVRLNKDVINTEYIRQHVKASSSVSANYIEASDDLGKADERMKIKTSRREAKEAIHFLRLVLTNGRKDLELERVYLLEEGAQIQKILSTIINRLS